MKKFATVFAVVAVALSLSACSSYSEHEGTTGDPVPVDDSFTTENLELGDGYRITCISDGFADAAVLSCVEAAESTTEFTQISETSYTVEYQKLVDGRVIPCLSDGFADSAVLSCVAQPR